MQHVERFNNLAEAEAFVRGLEYINNLTPDIEGPEIVIDADGEAEYLVYVTL